MSTALATLPQGKSVLVDMSVRFGMEPAAFEATLRATVCKGNVSKEEFAAFLLVAKEYNLNPLTREIYAFPAKGGGIQPIVGVDGWARIINDHPKFDGMEFEDIIDDGKLTAVTCRMHRKDRGHPISATEYMSECAGTTEPWRKWPSRMLRHKAMIQAARYAFGFSGIVEPDEYERMVNITPAAPPRLHAGFAPPQRIAHDATTGEILDTSSGAAASSPASESAEGGADAPGRPSPQSITLESDLGIRPDAEIVEAWVTLYREQIAGADSDAKLIALRKNAFDHGQLKSIHGADAKLCDRLDGELRDRMKVLKDAAKPADEDDSFPGDAPAGGGE